ncbi:MAG TPA: TlpA disulfide reductase family protein [Solirubrobacterales bacterium]|jgi:thiol-disulfide isomerase/thioredoxin|nr:TlpA disulfide reductase family protein [Solirubrobacterales bacterium]
MRRRITLALALLAGLATTAAVVGCGSSSGVETTHPNYTKALAGAPAPLAQLYDEADQILPGGKDAFEKRVAALGYPVVANVWASWCGPCRYEFPMFQEASAKWGKQVAFLGVDSEDTEKEAEKWLADHPVPYPSYYDPNFEVATSYKATGPPDTAFYNRQGELVEVKLGQYAHASELEEDIKRYALEGA